MYIASIKAIQRCCISTSICIAITSKCEQLLLMLITWNYFFICNELYFFALSSFTERPLVEYCMSEREEKKASGYASSSSCSSFSERFQRLAQEICHATSYHRNTQIEWTTCVWQNLLKNFKYFFFRKCSLHFVGGSEKFLVPAQIKP